MVKVKKKKKPKKQEQKTFFNRGIINLCPVIFYQKESLLQLSLKLTVSISSFQNIHKKFKWNILMSFLSDE